MPYQIRNEVNKLVKIEFIFSAFVFTSFIFHYDGKWYQSLDDKTKQSL